MRSALRHAWRAARPFGRRPDAAGEYPGAGEVVTEIGLVLAIHLAVAFAIGLSLRAVGIG
jgi:hypothetical protein